ncbi:GNAT family N-acetyltransferase [Kiloniella majae]|uniref:GNAT family N-acetyltransferase n=1 Tax=Kiloniella majae TaxID=1938558 RepID=UPI000A277CFD|nr:GNAT family N-acetyltransferase [Kiloniella majae]
MTNVRINDISVRIAGPDDMADILVWRNDPYVRSMSIDTGIIEPASHRHWYNKLLLDSNRLLLIYMLGSSKVGMIRFDADISQNWDISITVAPDFRGSGVGSKLLGLGIAFLKETRSVNLINAQVKTGNEPSTKLFSKYGFIEISRSNAVINLTLEPS